MNKQTEDTSYKISYKFNETCFKFSNRKFVNGRATLVLNENIRN